MNIRRKVIYIAVNPVVGTQKKNVADLALEHGCAASDTAGGHLYPLDIGIMLFFLLAPAVSCSVKLEIHPQCSFCVLHHPIIVLFFHFHFLTFNL